MTSFYAFAGDTIDPGDDRTPPTVTIARDVDGQRVLAQIDPAQAVELGRALIYAALRAQSGNFELDNIARRHALVARGYNVEVAAKVSPAVFAIFSV